MKDNKRRTVLDVEELETRSLMSGLSPGFGLGGGGFLFSSNTTVQADLAKLRTDGLKLQTDLATQLPKLQSDQQAIQMAVDNNTGVQSARAALSTALTNAQNTFQNDVTAITSATDTTTRAAAITKLYTDWSTLVPMIQADEAAVQSAVQTAFTRDPSVQAARTQLQTDAAPLLADQAAYQADLVQLQKDLHSQSA